LHNVNSRLVKFTWDLTASSNVDPQTVPSVGVFYKPMMNDMPAGPYKTAFQELKDYQQVQFDGFSVVAQLVDCRIMLLNKVPETTSGALNAVSDRVYPRTTYVFNNLNYGIPTDVITFLGTQNQFSNVRMLPFKKSKVIYRFKVPHHMRQPGFQFLSDYFSSSTEPPALNMEDLVNKAFTTPGGIFKGGLRMATEFATCLEVVPTWTSTFASAYPDLKQSVNLIYRFKVNAYFRGYTRNVMVV